MDLTGLYVATSYQGSRAVHVGHLLLTALVAPLTRARARTALDVAAGLEHGALGAGL